MPDIGRTPRLYVSDELACGGEIALSRQQVNYLVSVMRLSSGDLVRLFNARDGEWLCTLGAVNRKSATVTCESRIAPAGTLPDIEYLFAPLKAGRLDYMAQKATEMGACRLRPVFTERTVPTKVNMDRLRANVIEAAEQCEMIAIPQVSEPQPLEEVLAGWDPRRLIVFCDEAAPRSSACKVLLALPPSPLAVLVGPEGGFSRHEQDHLRSLRFVVPISLGPRVMRADTAAVAALAIVQSILGDWSIDQEN